MGNEPASFPRPSDHLDGGVFAGRDPRRNHTAGDVLKPYYQDDLVTVIHGNCLDVMREMDANSIDSFVTDPPYGLKFMGKAWDHGVPGVEFWNNALRIAKPGCHLLAFGGTRTYHRLTCAIEDAGWEIRDCLMWVYGSGFPKSYNVGQAIEKKLTTGHSRRPDRNLGGESRDRFSGSLDGELIADTGGQVELTTDEARQWQGFGTALKPAWEPIILARKPIEGAVADNVLKWGVGGLNIDGCRVGLASDKVPPVSRSYGSGKLAGGLNGDGEYQKVTHDGLGRFPSNFIHDGSQEVLDLFPMTGVSKGGGGKKSCIWTESSEDNKGKDYGDYTGFLDSGSAARYFYCAKASKRDRDEGLEDMELQAAGGMQGRNDGSMGTITMSRNSHPTVKPTDLMRYLCRLITPPNGLVCDPFMGSGSTGKAALLEGFRFIGIDKERQYCEIATKRLFK